MDTQLYDWSIPVISSLQEKFVDQAKFMQLMSVVFDPKYAFLIYSPLAYMFDHKVGKKLILTTVIAEWLNQILKWLLHGERPYWYVYSSGHFDGAQQVPIKQFPITCELGPGHPSGHAMVTAAVWYIILDSLFQLYQTNFNHSITTNQQQQHDKTKQQQHDDDERQQSSARMWMKLAMWTIYLSLLMLVSVSRVFLGCHFPHQCLAGAILGLLVAKYISSLETKALHFIGTSGFVLVSAFGSFSLLQALGFDPSWTIKLATTHCEKREYIHLDTAPFFSIMRYSGFALGCGLGLWLPLRRTRFHQVLAPYLDKLIGSLSGIEMQNCDSASSTAQSMATCDDTQMATDGTSNTTTTTTTTLLPSPKEADSEEEKSLFSSRNVSWFSVKLFMALLMARLVDNLNLYVSHASLPLFYSSAYLAYTLFSYAFINLSPVSFLHQHHH